MNMTKQQIKDFHKLAYQRGLDGQTVGRALRVLCDVGVGDIGTMVEATDEYQAELIESSKCLQPAESEDLCHNNEELASCIRSYEEQPIFRVGQRVHYRHDAEDTGTVRAVISTKQLYAVEWDSPSELDVYECEQLKFIEDDQAKDS